MFPILYSKTHSNGGLYAFTYIQESNWIPRGKREHIVKMSVIHVREAEMSWVLNLHTARSTEVPVCTGVSPVLDDKYIWQKDSVRISSGKNTPKEIIWRHTENLPQYMKINTKSPALSAHWEVSTNTPPHTGDNLLELISTQLYTALLEVVATFRIDLVAAVLLKRDLRRFLCKCGRKEEEIKVYKQLKN